MPERVLMVDDEPMLIAAYRRTLGRQLLVDTAESAQEALELLGTRGPYAVVVSDFQMPRMDGVTFLSIVGQRWPNTTRIMLTGQADLEVAVQAVNEGHVFRFLTKPCQPVPLLRAVEAGIRQYQLVTAEHELLHSTLTGSIKVLADVLSIASPAAFGRASRACRLARQLVEESSGDESWAVGIAAMLSQLGCIGLPQETVEKVSRGQPLTSEEEAAYGAHPALGSELIGRIPRLEKVAEAIALQMARFDGKGAPAGQRCGAALPIGARILRVVLDYDALSCAGLSSQDALHELKRRGEGAHDPEIVARLAEVVGARDEEVFRWVTLDEMETGMVLADGLESDTGALLLAAGQEVTPAVKAVLRSFVRRGRIEGPFRVTLPSLSTGTPE